MWRYRYDRFGRTIRSSQLYESPLLRVGSPMFHFGLLVVVIGNLAQLVVPKPLTDDLGRVQSAVPRRRARAGRRRRREPAGRPIRCGRRGPGAVRSARPRAAVRRGCG
nr:respiratory nitrate reductase subunit gamma [Amycolatopsis sp. FDAARGOS 1241]